VDKLAVRVVDLTKTYGTPAAPVHALRGVSLDVRQGEKVALLGRSGSGKSTLLNIVGGLDRPTSGGVVAAGRDLARLSARQLADYRMAHVGIVFQSFHLVASQSAAQNVELPMVFAGRPPRRRREAARRALEAVGLGHRLGHYPAELSGGERQRVAIARALVNSPSLLLADEPTGNLDTATAREVIDLLVAHLDRNGTTLILVTHDEELARRHADRVLRMTDGRLQE
jgi:predicted ABC-type transport system involved in lysophospholipase L1 biosynthesis ATPase subunit